jgi:hypothetical protein
MPAQAIAATEVLNAPALRSSLGLDAYRPVTALSGLKIAILDNGFAGFEPGKGQLPESAQLIAGPQNPEAPTHHGLGMAQIIWAMTGKRSEGPRLYLVNANGFTNFRAAIDFVVRERVDIVLYSQVWTFGSNFDGSGFINAEVSRATQAGILWINAAGNFGQLTHNGEIAGRIDPSSRFVLQADGADFVQFENKLDESSLTVTLSWTDFADSADAASSLDLDLLVYDSEERLVASSELIQRGEAPAPGDASSRLSSYPRESVALRGLDRGVYRIRVRAQSDGFRDTDRFRIVLESDKPGSIDFVDRTEGSEILPPADHAEVITVGETLASSSRGPTFDGRAKPDVLLREATVSFSNGNTVRGSSTAAALFAGAVALMKATRPDLDASLLKRYISSLAPLPNHQGGASDLYPTDPNAWPPLPPEVTALVPQGGRLMIAPNGHFVVLTPVDALSLPAFQAAGASRLDPEDLLCLNAQQPWQWQSLPAWQAARLEKPWVEFREVAGESAQWRTPSPAELESL